MWICKTEKKSPFIDVEFDEDQEGALKALWEEVTIDEEYEKINMVTTMRCIHQAFL